MTQSLISLPLFRADYVKFARKLLDAVRSSIEVDLSPADETEVDSSSWTWIYSSHQQHWVQQ